MPHVVPHLGNSDVFCPPVKGLVLAERFVVSIRFGGDTDRAVTHGSGNLMVRQIVPLEELANYAVPKSMWAPRIDRALDYCDDFCMEKKQRSSSVALSLAIISVIITPVLLFVEFSSLMLSEIFWVPIAVVALILPWMAFTWVKSGASRFLAGLVLLAWLAVQVWIGGTALGLWSLLG